MTQEPLFSDGDMPEPLDLSALTAKPLQDTSFLTPNHRASDQDGGGDEPPLSLKERLTGGRKPPPRVRNVKETKPRKVIPNRPGQFIEPLTDVYNGLALMVMPFEPELAMTLMSPHRTPTEEDPNPLTVAENCAKAWDEAAQRSESIRRMLDGFLTVSVFGTLVAAHAPLLMVLLKNHTSFGERIDPARAMESMLKRQAQGE